MKNVELMKEFLSSQGFRYEQSEDGNLFFKYQMRNFIYFANDEDQGFFHMAMPAIFDVTEDNREGILEVTNRITSSLKVAKAIVADNEVWLSTELLLDSTPVYDDIVPRVLDILIGAQQEFYNQIS